MVLAFRKPDPKIKPQRFGKNPAPSRAETFAVGKSADDFIKQKPKNSGCVGRSGFKWELRTLPLNGAHDAFPIEKIRRGIIQRAKPRAVSHDMLELQLLFARLRELRPKIHHACFQIQPRLVNRMKRACTRRGFCCGPHENDGRFVPRLLPRGIAKSSMERKHFLPALENTKSRTDLAALVEIPAKRLLDRPHSSLRSKWRSGSSFAISRNLSSIAKLVWA